MSSKQDVFGRSLLPDDINPVSQILARAFRDDPFITYLMPHEPTRIRILPWFLSTTVRYSLAYGEVTYAPQVGAVGCWLTPGNTAVTRFRALRTGGAAIPLRLGPRGFSRLRAWQAYTAGEHRKHAPEPHYYLYVLGVDPVYQGRGAGRTLLQPMLRRADTEGKACYLETHSEQNVRVYVSVGFGVQSVGRVGHTGLTVWALRREPA